MANNTYRNGRAAQASVLTGAGPGLTEEDKRNLAYAANVLQQRRAAQQARQTAPAPKGLSPATAVQSRTGPWGQFAAFGGGMSDALTFGLGDYASAGVQAVLGDGRDGALGERYRAQLELQRAQDAYDAAHFGYSRAAGQIAGAGVQLAALGPLDAAWVGGARIAQAAPMIAKEFGAVGGAGAALGLGGQAAADIVAGRRGSLGDYAGAGVGGAVNALAATRVGVGKAGAVGGGTTSVLQDAFNGRAPSVQDAAQAAGAGGLLSGAVGVGARVQTGRLSNSKKAATGEWLSQARTRARGDTTVSTAKSRTYLPSGRYTLPDQRTASGAMVESKFGNSARLSKNQREAHQTFGGKYRVDHFLPRDIGSFAGSVAEILGLPIPRDPRR